MRIRCIVWWLLALPFGVHAEVLQIATRHGSTLPVYWEAVADATATVILIPGHEGVVDLSDGKPKGKGFFHKAYKLFAAQKMNVVLVGLPASSAGSLEYRTGQEHSDDLAAIADTARKLSSAPVWLVGTSRGTVSAVSAAVRFGKDKFDGVVLTSSLVDSKLPHSLPRLNLGGVRIPVLMYHHAHDECVQCSVSDARQVIGLFKNAPVKHISVVEGGVDAIPGARPHHGFVGMEQQAAVEIAQWINKPVSD